LPNNRLSHAFARYIVTVASGYLAGGSVQYTAGDENAAGLEELQRAYAHADCQSVDMELAKCASLYGRGVELIYSGCDTRARSCALDPRSAFVVYDESAAHLPLFGVSLRPVQGESGVMQGFEAQVDGYDPFCPEKPEYAAMLRSKEQLLQGLGEYDYIISTLPANEQTEGFLNAELFGCMKKTAVIVNVGRKAVFNEAELYRALKSRQIGGAVLDMFEKLPNPITNPFRRLSNVVVLPGVSAISQEVNSRLKAHMYGNLLACLNGDTIQNVINKKV